MPETTIFVTGDDASFARIVALLRDAAPGVIVKRLDAGSGEGAALARTWQHSFNNPLSALLAEAQMLQMEAPDGEVKAAADRILELVRRLTELSRSMDAGRGRNPSR